MTKIRVKKPTTLTTTVEFIDVVQSGMVITHSFDDEPEVVSGAFVKVQPTIRASERSGVDSKAVRERLMAAGAAAVVVAPIVVPDSTKDLLDPARPLPVILSAEQHVRDWLEGVRGASILVLERALREALASVAEAGL
jgi:hypothetical protein